jgi:hypothetical protein
MIAIYEPTTKVTKGTTHKLYQECLCSRQCRPFHWKCNEQDLAAKDQLRSLMNCKRSRSGVNSIKRIINLKKKNPQRFVFAADI